MEKIRKYFNVTGYFYEKEQFGFRKFLNIIRKSSTIKTPDLMVIMMNPGSSRQEKEYANIFNKEVPTIPDNTQDQIMKVMNNLELNYARILNLSDLRESKSKILYEKIELLKSINIAHSIFDDRRTADFKNILSRDFL